jgi:anti-anti-sigma factor
MNMHAITQQKLRTGVVKLCTGRMLDNNNAHEMIEAITNAQHSEYKFIMIDMSILEFISSAGVGAILGTVGLVRESGGDIILYNVSITIMHILRVLDLEEYFTIKENEKEALAYCGTAETPA